MAECLFDDAAQAVRSLLQCCRELLDAVKEKNRDAINYLTGQITKIQEDSIKILPLANKLAYRRFFLKVSKIVYTLYMSSEY
jgi:hypothetical protein